MEMLQLIEFLNLLCGPTDDSSFVYRLAQQRSRWSTVLELLSPAQSERLERIGFASSREGDGFSPCNLKAHYVLDEDFINNGSAIILFSLVGSQWTHIAHVGDQNRFTSVDVWNDAESE